MDIFNQLSMNVKKVVLQTAFFMALAFCFTSNFGNSLYAASFQVSPVRANLSVTEKTSVFEFYNTGKDEVSVQVNVQKWMQDNGADVFENTRDVVVVPSVFKMKPGKKQIVRIAMLKPLKSDDELSYRVFFTELPNLAAEDSTKVKMRLRISVPVFIKPTGEPAPELLMSDFSLSGKTLQANNPSNQHVQILQFLLTTDTGEVIESTTGGYLLPKQSNQFKLDIPEGKVIKSIVAETDTAGKVSYESAL